MNRRTLLKGSVALPAAALLAAIPEQPMTATEVLLRRKAVTPPVPDFGAMIEEYYEASSVAVRRGTNGLRPTVVNETIIRESRQFRVAK